LLTATRLTAPLFFTLALLTFTLLSLTILLLSALLSGGAGFARFVWIFLCFHGAFFIIELVVWVVRSSRLDLFSQIGVENDLDVRQVFQPLT
jgi:hypothetical protein